MAAQDDAEVAYEHRLLDIEEKLKALPAVEKYELAPVLNRLTQYRKNDIKHASEYADLILNVLNIEPTEQTGQNEIVPPASPEITASSNELTREDLEKGEDLLAHYNEQMHAIQEKLNTLSQEERVKFIPALNQIAKYSQNDIQRASNYADIILNGLEVDDRNAKNPDTKKFDKSIAKDKKRFDAQDTTKSVKDNDDWRWQQKIKDAKAAEALREKIKAQQENDENAEFENLKWAAEVKAAKEQIEKSAQLSPVSRENSMNQFTPVVEPAPLPQKSGFFSGVAKGFKKLFGRN